MLQRREALEHVHRRGLIREHDIEVTNDLVLTGWDFDPLIDEFSGIRVRQELIGHTHPYIRAVKKLIDVDTSGAPRRNDALSREQHLCSPSRQLRAAGSRYRVSLAQWKIYPER